MTENKRLADFQTNNVNDDKDDAMVDLEDGETRPHERMRNSTSTSSIHNLRLRNRTSRKRYPTLVSDRVRHKRHTMQSMAKPLKQWLYEHKDYPYPSRREKYLLSSESSMTLVQVSNWFANARRRLKNTVSDPWMTWKQRIHNYNKHVTGNAERLSISSGDSSRQEFDGFDSDDEISTVNYSQDVGKSDNTINIHHLIANTNSTTPENTPSGLLQPMTPSQPALMSHHNICPAVHTDRYVTNRHGLPNHKFKNSMLQRYLNDSYEHAQRSGIDDYTNSNAAATTTYNSQKFQKDISHSAVVAAPDYKAQLPKPKEEYGFAIWSDRPVGSLINGGRKCGGPGSVSSHEYEYMSTSPESTSSSFTGHRRERHSSEDLSLASSSDVWTSFLKDAKNPQFKSKEDEETYWQEIVAAVALTNMARSRQQGK